MTSTIRVLIIDDEPAIHRFLQPSLGTVGYETSSAFSGEEGLRLMASTVPDVVVLDLGLPDLDGKEVIRRARQWSDIPIVVLSARDREAEKIESLDLGADDFVNKPFGVGELLARLRAALRHRLHRQGQAPTVAVGGITIDLVNRLVKKEGHAVKLTPREFDLLACLAKAPGKVMTHRHLLTAVWGPAHSDDTQYLRVYIGQLRDKLENDAANPCIILTELGVGYRLASEA